MKEIPITFKNRGKQIVGILHLPNRKKAPVIIMCHGGTGNKLGTWSAFFVKFAREFCKEGFAVLRFDFTGSGDSEGKYEDQNTTSILHDLDAVITEISKINGINKERIGLIGYSQGGRVSLLKSSSDERIKCLVTLAARTDLKYFWGDGWLDDMKFREPIYDDYKLTRKWLKDDLKYDVAKSIGEIKVPILVIHGDNDYSVPLSEAYRIFDLSDHPKKLHIVKGMNHVFSGEKTQKEVIRTSLIWFKKWLTRNKI